MNRAHAPLALAALTLLAPWFRSGAPAQEAGDPAVQVAGLQVQRALTRAGDWGPDMAFFGSQSATAVVLEVDLARVADAGERLIVELLREESKVARFVDDQGTDLAAGFDETFGPFDMQTQVSGDQLRIAAAVKTDTKPAAGATRLELEGTLALFCASEKEQVESEAADLAKGAQLAAGSYSFEVTGIGKPDWGDAEMAITLRTKADVGAITGWWIVTPDGEAVELDQTMTGRMLGVTDVTLNAPRKLARGALRVERWADGATLELPFSVKAGLGL
jgi:hypothetical protein